MRRQAFWPAIRPAVANRREEGWAVLCFLMAAVCGLIANVVAERNLGLSGIGSLNLSLSFLLIMGQVSCLGVHSAVAYFVPMAVARGTSPINVVRSGIRLVLKKSIWLSITAWGTSGFAVLLISRSDLLILVWWTAAAISFFSINKVLLALFSGIRDTVLASAGNALRFGFLAISLLLVTQFSNELYVAGFSVAASEALTTCVLYRRFCRWQKRQRSLPTPNQEETETTNDLKQFGRKSFASSLIIDLNSRVDIICLALLSSATEVGRYSIAVFFAEALFQLALSWRIAVEPRIARYLVESNKSGLVSFLSKKTNEAYLALIPVGVASIVLYAPATSFLYGNSAAGTYSLYLILGTAVTLTLGLLPQMFVAQQLGNPRLQARILMRMLIVNIVLNLALVPFLGAYGSAIGFGVSLLTVIPSNILLRRMIRGN